MSYKKVMSCVLAVMLTGTIAAPGVPKSVSADNTVLPITLGYSAYDVRVDETTFPDENFRQYVLDSFVDNDYGVLSGDISMTMTEMTIDELGIKSLKGIEYFPNLTYLSCRGNELTELDLSKNTKLEYLYCYDNSISSLDLSNNTALQLIYATGNNMKNIELGSNSSLKTLFLHANDLRRLDVSGCPELETLYAGWNTLTFLDLSNNPALYSLQTEGNVLYTGDIGSSIDYSEFVGLGFDHTRMMNLTGAEYDAASNSFIHILKHDITYDYDCGNGKTHQVTITVGEFTDDSAIVSSIDENYFPDPAFRAYVSEEIDLNGDNMLSEMEIMNTSEIDVRDKGIKSLKGVELFTGLTYLDCSHNDLSELDVSGFASLQTLYCQKNPGLEGITLGTEAKELKVYASFDLSMSVRDWMEANQLYSMSINNFENDDWAITLDENGVGDLTFLDEFDFDKTEPYHWAGADYDPASGTISNVKYSYVKAISAKYEPVTLKINMTDDHYVAISEENFPDAGLREYLNEWDWYWSGRLGTYQLLCMGWVGLDDRGIKDITGLDLLPYTTGVGVGGNELVNADLTNMKSLTALYANDNKLTSIDMAGLSHLKSFTCTGNHLTSLDLSGTALTPETFDNENVEGNEYYISVSEGSCSLSELEEYGFDPSKASNWQGAKYDAAANSLSGFTSKTVTYDYDCGNGITVTFTLIADTEIVNEEFDMSVTAANGEKLAFVDENGETVSEDSEIILEVEPVDEELSEEAAGEIEAAGEEVQAVYDITLTCDGSAVQPDGSIRITMAVPEGVDGSTARILRMEEDGTLSDMKAEYDGENGTISFVTEHLSIYVLSHKAPAEFAMGDVDHSGKVDTDDVVLILQKLANYDVDIDEKLADVDKNGRVDSDDAVLILQKLANYDVDF